MLLSQKPRLLLWSDISISQIDSFNNSYDNENIRNNLRKVFYINLYDSEIKQEIMLDLFFYCYKFCKTHNFSEEQISVFLSLVQNVHKLNSESSFDNSEAVFQFFNESLLLHCVHRPPFSLEIFNSEQFKLISEYLIDTYFRHFKMYKYAFTAEVLLDLKIGYPNITEEVKEAEIKVEPEITADEIETVDQEDSAGESFTVSTETSNEQSDSILLLRKFIRSFLSDEMKKVKGDIDDRLKVVKESINSKLNTVDIDSATKGKKSAKGSANKGKKK